MNPSNRCSFFLDLIAVASIGPISLSFITIMYLLPCADGIRNTPIWLLDVMPFRLSNLTAVTYLICSRFFICLNIKYSSDRSSFVSSINSLTVNFVVRRRFFLTL